MAKNYTQPQLTAHGNIEELTQVTGTAGGNDTFFSATGDIILTGRGTDDETAVGGPVTITPGTPTGVPIS